MLTHNYSYEATLTDAIKVAFINPLNESVQFIPWIVNRDVIAIIPILLIAGAIVALLAGLVGMRRFLDV